VRIQSPRDMPPWARTLYRWRTEMWCAAASCAAFSDGSDRCARAYSRMRSCRVACRESLASAEASRWVLMRARTSSMLGRPTAAAPGWVKMSGPVPGLQQHRHLLVPGAAAQRVAVNKHDGCPGAMVFVIQIDRPGVLLSYGYVRHAVLPCGVAMAF
jgi:hypothetical protein